MKNFFVLILLAIGAMDVQAQQHFVLDRNFGNSCGITQIGIANPDVYELFKLSSGKYMLIGNTGAAPDRDILFIRYNSDGTPDMDFGTNGVKIFSFDVQNDINSISYSNNKIYIVGHQAPGSAYSSFRASVSRFDENADPDLTFNGTGTLVEEVFTNPISCSFYTHVLVQPDDKIVCYGFESSNINGGTNIAVGKRYNDDGSVDSGFNPGLTYPSFVLGSTIYNSPGILDENGSMRFVYPSTSGVNNIASIKIDSNGDPDLTYGLNGMNYTSVESDPNTVHHYRERNGVIYGVRLKTNADQDMRAYSLDSSGNLNTSFSDDGILDIMNFPGSSGTERPSAIHSDSGDKLYFIGSGSFSTDQGAFCRTDMEGNYDLSLNGDGTYHLGEFPYLEFRASYFENDSTIILANLVNSTTGLVKLHLQTSNISISVPDDGIICAGSSTEISILNPSDCYSYVWTIDGESFAGNDSVITVSEAGVYQVIASGGAETSYSQNIIITVLDCSNIQESSGNLWNIFPNPIDEVCVINSSVLQGECSVIDITSKTISSFILNGENQLIDFTRCAAGLYFIKHHASGCVVKVMVK